MNVSFWDWFFWYIDTGGFSKIINLFWYFFYLELPRFMLLDVVVLVILTIKNVLGHKKYEIARQRLFIEKPFISIIVPGKNEGRHIYKLTKALREQTYKNFELIVIDDGSTDDTHTIGLSLLKSGLIDKFLRNDERGGKASAANLGLRFSSGKYIVHLDADTSFDRDAIERILIPFYLDEKIAGIGGNIKVLNRKASLCAGIQSFEYLQTLTVGRMVTSFFGIYRIISGAFGAFKKDALMQIGGWDIGPGLAGAITVKLRKIGYKVVFEHRAIALTNAPEKFRALTKQRLRWSKSMIRFRVRKHKDVFVPNQNFNLLNFIAFFDNIFFNLILDFLWFYYIIQIIIYNFEFLGFIIPLKFIIYTIAIFAQYLVIMAVSERRKQEYQLAIYIPAMMLYAGYYMRIVRTIAYVQELFFFKSYKDPWNPKKTSDQALEHGL